MAENRLPPCESGRCPHCRPGKLESNPGTAVPANRSLPERIMEEVLKVKDTPAEPTIVLHAPPHKGVPPATVVRGDDSDLMFRLRVWDALGCCYEDRPERHARPLLLEALRKAGARGITATVSFLSPGGGYKTLIYTRGQFVGEIKTAEEATWKQINESDEGVMT